MPPLTNAVAVPLALPEQSGSVLEIESINGVGSTTKLLSATLQPLPSVPVTSIDPSVSKVAF